MQALPELNMNMINMQSSLWNLALFFIAYRDCLLLINQVMAWKIMLVSFFGW